MAYIADDIKYQGIPCRLGLYRTLHDDTPALFLDAPLDTVNEQTLIDAGFIEAHDGTWLYLLPEEEYGELLLAYSGFRGIRYRGVLCRLGNGDKYPILYVDDRNPTDQWTVINAGFWDIYKGALWVKELSAEEYSGIVHQMAALTGRICTTYTLARKENV